MIKLLNKENNCLTIAKSTSENPAGQTGRPAYDDIFLKLESEGNFIKGNVGNTPLILMQYKKKDLFSKIFFKNKNDEIIFVEYYYGGCI